MSTEIPENNLEIVERKSSIRTKWLLTIGIVALLLVICLGGMAYFIISQLTSGVETNTLAVLTEVVSPKPLSLNQIAFVGNDNNIWIAAPDGQQLRHITTGGEGYRFPTWSPDGRWLAFIGPDENDNTVLFVAPTQQGEPRLIFSDENAAPFYLYWAPDSQTITFLTQESAGLSMRQVDVNRPEEHRILGQGNPFYWVWSPAGDRLLMHVGGARAISEEAHISLLDNRADAKRVQLDLAPGRFQAPVWSSDGQTFYYIAANRDGLEAIYRSNATTLAQTLVTNLRGFALMILSPDDKHLAYLQIEPGNRPPFGTAYVVGTDGTGNKKLTDWPVGSMYWSPDGRKLAILTLTQGGSDGSSAKAGGLAVPLPQGLQFRWWVYDLATGELEPLISFIPTPAFLQTVPYFDQYHLSLTFWSPDSRYLVITKDDPNTSNQGTVWVVDTTGEEEPQVVGQGRLAVWSWR